MRFAFIAAKMAEFPITVLCRVLEVSRAGFYASIGRSPPPRVIADEKLAVLVREAHEKSRRTYGSPRVQAELADVYGVNVSRKAHHPAHAAAGPQGARASGSSARRTASTTSRSRRTSSTATSRLTARTRSGSATRPSS